MAIQSIRILFNTYHWLLNEEGVSLSVFIKWGNLWLSYVQLVQYQEYRDWIQCQWRTLYQVHITPHLSRNLIKNIRTDILLSSKSISISFARNCLEFILYWKRNGWSTIIEFCKKKHELFYFHRSNEILFRKANSGFGQ